MIQSTNDLLIKNWDKINKYCYAVYLGGSRVDMSIDKPHDYDYIWFVKPRQYNFLIVCLRDIGIKCANVGSTKTNKNKVEPELLIDCSQCRFIPSTKITWFSYLDPLMRLVAGDDICPKTDIIYKHRKEFIEELKNKANLINTNRIKNQKRWYHILRGIYILLNNSYEVNEEQKKELNILHDLDNNWEAVRDKTLKLLSNLS